MARCSARAGERGMAMIVVLLLLAALVGVVTVSLVGSLSSSISAGDERAHRVATFAAESGVAAGYDFLYANCAPGTYFSAYLSPGNSKPQAPAAIAGNGAQPGAPGNPFDPTLQAWYEVYVLNDPIDPGFDGTSPPLDHDGIVYLKAIGHGPDNASYTVQVEVADGVCGSATPTGGYGQENGNAQNTGSTTSGAVTNASVTTLNAGSL